MGRSGGQAKRIKSSKQSVSRSALKNRVPDEKKLDLFSDATDILASQFHNDWRSSRLQEDGSYEPRIKTTTDQEWIEENGTDQVDIANTDFVDLPSDWQAENKAAAETAIDALMIADDAEKAAALIHESWLDRNGEWAEDHQKLPYDELSEEEKEKDRLQVEAASAVLEDQSRLFAEEIEKDISERKEAVTSMASQFHEDWREERKADEGQFFEPRIKTTKDEDWIKENGGDEVDIANTEFKDLPSDWQEENRAAAEAAMEAISKADNVEEAAAMVHDSWLERNGEWAEEHQKLPYAELSEEEKEKDRQQVITALEHSSGYERPTDPGIGGAPSGYIRPTIEGKLGEGDTEKETEALASQFHDDWRNTRESVAFEPRIKTTKDEEWIKENGTDQVDIANTSYQDLPSDWQAENKAAAEAAYVAVKEAHNIESAAAQIHESWLDRNGEWAEDHQKLPYEELSEEEKEKDRLQARLAIETIPGLSLVEYPEGHEPMAGTFREGTIKGGGRRASLASAALDKAQSEFDRAQSGLRFAVDFSAEGRAIAEYAQARSEKTKEDPLDIVEKVYENPKKYKRYIPEVEENSGQHSGFSWGSITIRAAKALVQSDISDTQSEASQSIREYIDSEADEVAETRRVLQMRIRAAKEAAKNLSSRPGFEDYAEEILQNLD